MKKQQYKNTPIFIIACIHSFVRNKKVNIVAFILSIVGCILLAIFTAKELINISEYTYYQIGVLLLVIGAIAILNGRLWRSNKEDNFYYKSETPKIKIKLKTEHLKYLFNNGNFKTSDAEHYNKQGYEFVLDNGGNVIAIIPPEEIL